MQGPLLVEESPPPLAVPDTAQEVRSKYEPSARLAKFKVGQRVDARFKNTRRYYGAFVTSANLDNTYSVYFYESSEECHHVQEAHIKLPLNVKCNRTFRSWDFFKGKVFSDPLLVSLNLETLSLNQLPSITIFCVFVWVKRRVPVKNST